MLHGALPLRSRRRRALLVQAAGLSVCALTGPWALPRAAAAEGALTIETGSPDALCPELESTRAAVRRRLGELVVPGGGFVARYTIGHALGGSPRDFVKLELLSSDGAVLLARELPLAGESCSTMSEVIALVLDRYFRALLGGDAPPPAEQAPVTAASTPPAAQAHAPPVSAPALAPAAPPPSAPAAPAAAAAPLETSPDRLAELALDLAFRDLQRPTLGARATLELWPWLYAGTALHLSLLQERETLLNGGQVESRDAVWRTYLGWAWGLGALRAYLGPGVRAGIERATGRGLEQSSAGLRVSWGVGADAGVIWSLRNAWTLHVSGALDVHVPGLGGQFYVESAEVLRPSPVRGWLGVGVGYDL